MEGKINTYFLPPPEGVRISCCGGELCNGAGAGLGAGSGWPSYWVLLITLGIVLACGLATLLLYTANLLCSRCRR